MRVNRDKSKEEILCFSIYCPGSQTWMWIQISAMFLKCVLKDQKEIYWVGHPSKYSPINDQLWSFWCGGIWISVDFLLSILLLFFYSIKNRYTGRWCWPGTGMSWCLSSPGPRRPSPAMWRWGSVFMGSYIVHSPLRIPSKRGSPFKAQTQAPKPPL